MDKITVIIPIYNSEKYLSACIDSILAQTYQNFEVILVDDGSTDRSGEICDEYCERDQRIRVIHKTNEGVSAARNDGLTSATGDWISFIDSDDTMEPDMYELLINTAKKYDAEISHCGYKHIVRNEVRLVRDTHKVYVQSASEALSCLIDGRIFGGGLWNKLFARDIIHGLRFRADLKNNEDILFNFEAFQKAQCIVFADEAKYNYMARIGESTVFTIQERKKTRDSLVVNEYIYQAMRKTELRDVAATRYLRTLSGYYRFLSSDKGQNAECKIVKNEIWNVYKESRNVERGIAITVWMIHLCPWLYRIIYTYYNRMRKPNWEVRDE